MSSWPECPRCGVGVGERCVSESGYPARHPHSARLLPRATESETAAPFPHRDDIPEGTRRWALAHGLRPQTWGEYHASMGRAPDPSGVHIAPDGTAYRYQTSAERQARRVQYAHELRRRALSAWLEALPPRLRAEAARQIREKWGDKNEEETY